ncbi:MAG: LLM class flavin-dependent oxidoreductase [Alphaproteobacteria bacterium]|nr:LLM class flavin-dependent oxidoreductase [Alphaproteobacteria bacterium]
MLLNILCQSPVSEGSTPSDAIRNTLELAQLADRTGYHRFWVAEHHSDPALASASPEILVAHLAATTRNLHIGSGGVLLPYYSPFKVAEQFRMLAALHPGRIDLGIGRSGGSEGEAPAALGIHAPDSFRAMDELLGWLAGRRMRRETFASPDGVTPPTPWMLGTSPASARFAGERGLPYAFGGFLDPRQMGESLQTYHQTFQPSVWADRPRVNLAWYVQAAETEREARELTRSSEEWFVDCLLRGSCQPFPDPARLGEPGWSPMERMLVEMRRQLSLVGTGEQVVAGLRALKAQTAADELTLVTIPWSHEARLTSYRLIAEAADLRPSPVAGPTATVGYA